MKVYMDNGATTKVDKEVIKAMLPYFDKYYGNPSSLHSFGREAREAIDKARQIVAKKLGAEQEEIVFTSGGTESDNLALKGVLYANKKKGKHIITSSIEHSAVYNTCKYLESQGFKVTYLPVDSEGFVNPDDLQKAITKETVLVSIIHGNNEIGTIQDLKALGDICKDKGVYFHTDAVQSFTKVPIDVRKINVDLVSMSAHKLHGPKGVGALFVKKGTIIERQNIGGPHEFRLRSGTENVPGIVGFGKAVELAPTQEKIKEIASLRDRLMDGLLELEDTKLNGPRGKKRLCNNVNISFGKVEGESILIHLDSRGIAVSTASACSSRSLKPSRILLAIGLSPEVAHGTIRFTLSKYTTRKEVDYVIKNTKEVVSLLRGMSPLVRENERKIYRESGGKILSSHECW